MPKSKHKHIRIVCPHCRKHVSLAPPRTRFGFMRPVPCPNCHIPISPAHIKVQTEPIPQPAEEGAEAATPASEAGDAATTAATSAAEEGTGQGENEG